MKNKVKYLTIGFVCGALMFSFIGAYASTLIASSNVSYDNTNSGLTSTNVKDAVDTLYEKANVGSATSSEILNNKTALVKGKLLTGTMPNLGSWNATPTQSGRVTIPEGYHDGTGYVDTSTLYQLAIDSVSASTNISSITYLGRTNSLSCSQDYLAVIGITPGVISASGTATYVTRFVARTPGDVSYYYTLYKDVKAGAYFYNSSSAYTGVFIGIN